MSDLTRSRVKEGGNSQRLKLLSRGNDMSGAPISNGTIQLPKPPIKAGITKKKIITNAWEVTTTLYNWGDAIKVPGFESSKRISNDKPLPTSPAQILKTK